jgi:hypothetical protein
MKKHLAFLIICIGPIFFCHAQVDSLSNAIEKPLWQTEIPRYNVFVEVGITAPTASYEEVARSGLNMAVGSDVYFNRHIGLSGSFRYNMNNFKYGSATVEETTDKPIEFYALSIGPVFSYTVKDFQLDFMTRAGVALLNVPDNSIIDQSTAISGITQDNGSETSTPFVDLGLRFSYYFRNGVQLYASPQYHFTVGEPINGRSVSLNNFSSTPDRFDISNILFNLGVKVSLGKVYSNGERLSPETDLF